jgi:hypothetical protein
MQLTTKKKNAGLGFARAPRSVVLFYTRARGSRDVVIPTLNVVKVARA